MINGYKTYYLKSERGAEIDFVIQRDGQLIPNEVKSADNTRAKSLKVYMDAYKPAYAIKLSDKNFGFEDNKKRFRCMCFSVFISIKNKPNRVRCASRFGLFRRILL